MPTKKLTNRMNLPEGIVKAVVNDPYNSGGSDISVTRLIAPPYQRKLMGEVDQIEDVSDRVWSLIGQATHAILERAYPENRFTLDMSIADFFAKYNYLTEERLYTTVNGWTVSGAFDVYENETIFDYKITSVWSVIGDTKKEWEQQLNLLRLLAIRTGLVVGRLRIIAILRDWSKMKAKTDPSYPQAQVVSVEIPVWTVEETEQYMLDRVLAHQSANPPQCTAVDRWQRDDVYAVMKEGRKSAVKLHDNSNSASDHRDTLGSGHTVVKRPGESIRCASYCSVAHACPAYQSETPF